MTQRPRSDWDGLLSRYCALQIAAFHSIVIHTVFTDFLLQVVHMSVFFDSPIRYVILPGSILHANQ